MVPKKKRLQASNRSILHIFYNIHPKHEHPTEHNSIVNDNVVERPSSMAEKIASGGYEILSL